MRKSGKRKPGRYDLRFCIQLALAACISFYTKITVRFKLNLKTDGLAYRMIFKTGERIERFHSCSKQGRRIYNVCICKQCFRLYKNTFCVAKCLLGNPKPLYCTVPEQAVRLYHFVK